MPLFTCDVAGCQKSVLRSFEGSCRLCNQHICAKHTRLPFHDFLNDGVPDHVAYASAIHKHAKCDLRALTDRINLTALCARATSLKDGIPCTASSFSPETAAVSGNNMLVPLTFMDGIQWEAQIRLRNASSPPLILESTSLLSEVATLLFLATTKIPVPRVFGYGLESNDNPVGVGYILTERVQGKAFNNQSSTLEQKRRVYDQLATIYIQIRANGFPLIGSLLIPGDKTIGGCLNQEAAEVDKNGVVRLLKSFPDSREYRRAVVEHRLALIQNGAAYIKDPVTAYLVYHRVLRAIDDYYQMISPSGPFYLLHPNDTGDHILVDDQYNIVALTNWDNAQTVPLEDDFKAPSMMLDAPKYNSGDNSLSEDEKLFSDIIREKRHFHFAGLVESGRGEHRLKDVLGADVEDERFQVKFAAFLAAYAKEDTSSFSWEEWKADYTNLLIGSSDEGFKQVAKNAR